MTTQIEDVKEDSSPEAWTTDEPEMVDEIQEDAEVEEETEVEAEADTEDSEDTSIETETDSQEDVEAEPEKKAESAAVIGLRKALLKERAKRQAAEQKSVEVPAAPTKLKYPTEEDAKYDTEKHREMVAEYNDKLIEEKVRKLDEERQAKRKQDEQQAQLEAFYNEDKEYQQILKEIDEEEIVYPAAVAMAVQIQGPKLDKYILQHRDELLPRLQSMTREEQLMEMGAIKARLEAPVAQSQKIPPKKKTQAPPPIKQVKSTPAPVVDAGGWSAY